MMNPDLKHSRFKSSDEQRNFNWASMSPMCHLGAVMTFVILNLHIDTCLSLHYTTFANCRSIIPLVKNVLLEHELGVVEPELLEVVVLQHHGNHVGLWSYGQLRPIAPTNAPLANLSAHGVVD